MTNDMSLNQAHNKSKPVSILIVDDDEEDVLLIKRCLGNSDCDFLVHTEPTGDEALAYLERLAESSNRPDVVLLDLNMPGKSGHETLEQIRNDPNLGFLPVVILTTSDQPSDMALAFENHAQCFATKPTSLEEYSRLVDKIFTFWQRAQQNTSCAGQPE
jgi:chemotaxis family two-component system response regulator Rcp1